MLTELQDGLSFLQSSTKVHDTTFFLNKLYIKQCAQFLTVTTDGAKMRLVKAILISLSASLIHGSIPCVFNIWDWMDLTL